jgi:hypothetical protein
MGTGRNVFGGCISWRHGNPGAVLQTSDEAITDYCRLASDPEKWKIYDTLCSGEQTTIRELAAQINKAFWGSRETNTEP